MQLPEIGRETRGELGPDVVEELVLEALLADGLGKRRLRVRRRVAKIGFERLVLRAERIFVDVAI